MTNTQQAQIRVGADISGKHTVTLQLTIEYNYEGGDDTQDMDEMIRDLIIEELDQVDGHSYGSSWVREDGWRYVQVRPASVSVDIVDIYE